ncbi:hypothetical protein BH23ACT5_BH23ACT5_10610 [soil metagenome]
MTDTGSVPEDPAALAQGLVAVEADIAWLLPAIHDLELLLHDQVEPGLAKVGDDLAWIESRATTENSHGPAQEPDEGKQPDDDEATSEGAFMSGSHSGTDPVETEEVRAGAPPEGGPAPEGPAPEPGTDGADGDFAPDPEAGAGVSTEWLEGELRRVKASFSWRVTSPLRFARHRLQRLVGRS